MCLGTSTAVALRNHGSASLAVSLCGRATLQGQQKVRHKTVPFVTYWHIVLTPALDHRKLLDDAGDGVSGSEGTSTLPTALC